MDPLVKNCEEVAGLLKELSHPQRLLMLCHMAHGAKSVSELTEMGAASQSQVSQFLRQMKSEGLVSARRDGKFVYYKISNPKVEKLIRALRQICGA